MPKLTDLKCKNAKNGPRILGDGDGLSLKLTTSGTKSWILRWQENGTAKNMGLGKYPDVSLADARKRALDARKHISNGRNPVAERNRVSAATFHDTAFKCLETHKTSGKITDKKTIHQWTKTIEVVCEPFLDIAISKVTFEDVIEVLRQRFIDTPVSAQRELQRIRRIFSYAGAMKWLPDGNPVGQDSDIEQILVMPTNREVKHHTALDYKLLPAFVRKLETRKGGSARALEFTILNNLRTSETLHIKWEHIDFENRVLTIPAANKKERRELRIPLTAYSLLFIHELQKTSKSEYLFPSPSNLNKPLSNMAMLTLVKRMLKADAGETITSKITVHGFRSTFQDYMSDQDHHNFDFDAIENALGHLVGNKVTQAYRRNDAFEKRCLLMDVWHDYMFHGDAINRGDNIVPIDLRIRN